MHNPAPDAPAELAFPEAGAEAGLPAVAEAAPADIAVPAAETEIGGPAGPEPTRYGDWEKKGRCIDF